LSDGVSAWLVFGGYFKSSNVNDLMSGEGWISGPSPPPEFKHQNISAVLKGLGEDWIPGYKPAFNFQMTLVDAVARWLALNPAWLGRQPGLQPAAALREAVQIWIGPPPTLSNQRKRPV
jgi:hypothetical protein